MQDSDRVAQLMDSGLAAPAAQDMPADEVIWQVASANAWTEDQVRRIADGTLTPEEADREQ